MKKLVGIAGLLGGLLLASVSLAKPTLRSPHDFDAVGRPADEGAQHARTDKAAKQRHAASYQNQTTRAPMLVDHRREKGELWESYTPHRIGHARAPEQAKQRRTGESPIRDKRMEQRANCSDLVPCGAAAPNAAKSPDTKKGKSYHTPPAGVPYSQRVKWIRMNKLKSMFLPAVGDTCKNGTDCWLP